MDFADFLSDPGKYSEPFKPGKLTDKEEFGKALLALHKKTKSNDREEPSEVQEV